MTLNPRRVALAVVVMFVLFSVKWVFAANPSRTCETPMIGEAFKGKADITSRPPSSEGHSVDAHVLQAQGRNACIDHARGKIGAAATRLVFLSFFGARVAMMLGWRARGNGDQDQEPRIPDAKTAA